MNETDFIATAPAGVEAVLAVELAALGITKSHPVRAGVRFSGTLEQAYRACLWSRAASRKPFRQHCDKPQGPCPCTPAGT